MNACSICENTDGNKVHVAREMMFGFRDRFNYLECARCGCLQLLDIPQDMAKYYPRNYYSYQQHGWFLTAIRRRWSTYAFGGFSPLGWMISKFIMQNRALMAVRRLEPPKLTRILDVGCGSGRLLLDLKYLGFPNVTGLDPYIERDLVYDGGPTVFKKGLDQMQGEFDLIMLHHSFEHLDNPAGNLRSLAKLLAPKGQIILRIPVASSYGWRHYGVNWVHLDAPRHLYLHSGESIRLLAEQAGLRVDQTLHEADEGTFWCSEAYARDISMYDPRAPQSSLIKRLLTWRQSQKYRAMADEINRRGEADMVCFVLRKAGLA